jgi:hypothetical protein
MQGYGLGFNEHWEKESANIPNSHYHEIYRYDPDYQFSCHLKLPVPSMHSVFNFVVQGASQRFALVVGGRAGKMPESRKNPKPEKCL